MKSCESIEALAAKHDVYTPIVQAVATLIRGEITPQEMVTHLISRAAKSERH